MNDDISSRQRIVDRIDQSPARYVWAGIITLLGSILVCFGAVSLLSNRATPPTPPSAPRARVEFAAPVQPGQDLSIRGLGFQPNERVELFASNSVKATFSQLVKLGDAIADGNGNFGVATKFPAVDGPLFITAKGSSSGFVSFAASGVASGAPPAPPPGTQPVIPVQGTSNLPDLAVGTFTIEPQVPTTCAPNGVQPALGVKVEIRNSTPYPAGPFVVQVNNTQYTVNNGLAGARSIVLWFPGYVTGVNRVTIDTANQVQELEETRNNALELPLAVPNPYPNCPSVPAPNTPAPPAPVGPTVTPDPNAINVWYAQYYNNQELFEPAIIKRYESGNPFLNLDWRGGSPGAGIPNDNYSGVIQRVQEFPTSDNYLFDFTVDDGGRLYIDGVLVIDEWRNGGARTVQASRSLTRGAHTIRIEFYENTGSARVALNWKRSYTGWYGRYYSNPERTGQPVLIADDKDPNGTLGLNFDWGFGSPGAEVPTDGFSADWQRTLNFPQGTYLFTVEVDDGARIFIDGAPLIDNYNTSGNRVVTQTRTLAAGPHSIQVQYVEYSGQAKFKLSWERLSPATPIPAPSVTASPIPVFPTATVPPPPTPAPTNTPNGAPGPIPTATGVVVPSATPDTSGGGGSGVVIVVTSAP
jgi:hypothetical protein